VHNRPQRFWIGIQTTPKTAIAIQSVIERDGDAKTRLMLDYNVPLKDGKTILVKAVNWPKAFFVPDLTPCSEGEKEREKLFQLLAQHSVPLGTEQKFINTVALFDHSVNVRRKELHLRKSKSQPTNTRRGKPPRLVVGKIERSVE
jgi:hypothetical protein